MVLIYSQGKVCRNRFEPLKVIDTNFDKITQTSL